MLKVLNFLNNEKIFKISTEFKHNDNKHYDKLLEEIKDAIACNDSTKIISAIDRFNIVCRKQAIMDAIKSLSDEMASNVISSMGSALNILKGHKDTERGHNKSVSYIDELGYVRESSVDSSPIEDTSTTPPDEMVFLPEETQGELSEEEREVARRINSADVNPETVFGYTGLNQNGYISVTNNPISMVNPLDTDFGKMCADKHNADLKANDKAIANIPIDQQMNEVSKSNRMETPKMQMVNEKTGEVINFKVVIDPSFTEEEVQKSLSEFNKVLSKKESNLNNNLNNCDLKKDVDHSSGLNLSSNLAELIKEEKL